MTTPIKKFIKLNNHAQDVLCLQYVQKRGQVTIGGANKLQERIYGIYLGPFKECDGDPMFHSVVRGKCRLKFTCSYKQFLSACEKLKVAGMDIETTESFGRIM